MNDEKLELIVDTEDNYRSSEHQFYIHPQRLNFVRCLSDNQFVSCTVKNTSIENLTSMNFSYILRKLKPNSVLEVIIFQPISVMQEYDAKQVEANAKLAGFVEFETNNYMNVDSKTEKKYQTLAVTCVKPEKKQSEEVTVEVTVTKKNDTKAKDQNQKNSIRGASSTKTTTTTITTATNDKGSKTSSTTNSTKTNGRK
jgi:hypothetical protein